jgi:putative AdoMet-dependent methyltransferase
MAETEGLWTTWDFDGAAEGYDSMVPGSSPLYARYEEVLDTVARLSQAGPGTRVLEIGVGTGNLALRCLKRGAAVVGLDPSGPMLARARAKLRGMGSVQLLQVGSPFVEIPFADACFHAVVSTYAFHHVPPPLKPAGVREMLRVTQPGGHWVIGDLAFRDERAEQEAFARYPWLEEEYFARVEELRPVFAGLGVALRAQQFTPTTWVVSATKPLDRPVPDDPT